MCVSGVYVRALFEQGLDHVSFPLLGGGVQRGPRLVNLNLGREILSCARYNRV
jgi:hypothetical protein